MLNARWTAAVLLCAAALSLPFAASALAKDLPFAPPRKKEPVAAPTCPIVFSPFEHEAVVAVLEPGWTMANSIADAKKVVLMQFLAPGDDPENVQTMINVVTYRDMRSSNFNARDFMVTSKKNSEKLAPKGSLDWDVIADDNPNDVIFEYSVKGWKETPDQFEMQRVIKGQDGIHSIIYHRTATSVSQVERAKMLAFLKSVKIRNKKEFAGLPPVSLAPEDGSSNHAGTQPPAVSKAVPQSKSAVSASNAAPTK